MIPAAARADELDDCNVLRHGASVQYFHRTEIVGFAVALEPDLPASVNIKMTHNSNKTDFSFHFHPEP